MKKLIFTLVAIMFISYSYSFAIRIDISDAEITITGASTFTMNNVSADNQYYWIDFVWNSSSNKFVPEGYGPEDRDIFGKNFIKESCSGKDVEIDISIAIPNIPTSTEFRLYNLIALGSTYWGAWKWNEITNKFDTWYYGEEGKVTDIDGNVYRTVKIGNQWWMAENLKVTHYLNGDPIPNVTDNQEWTKLHTGAYCDYENNESFIPTYGRLYNWFAVDDSRNIAPEGWHVPTGREWSKLVDYFGGSNIAGVKMKETGTIHWRSPNTDSTNEKGFSALPGGLRGNFGHFYELGECTDFWELKAPSSDFAVGRELTYHSPKVIRGFYYKHYGFSVRCVRD